MPVVSVITSKTPQVVLLTKTMGSDYTPSLRSYISSASTPSMLSTECVSPALNAAQTVDSSHILPDSSWPTRRVGQLEIVKRRVNTEDGILKKLERIDLEKEVMEINEDTAFCAFVAHMLSKLSEEPRRAAQLRILQILHDARKNDLGSS